MSLKFFPKLSFHSKLNAYTISNTISNTSSNTNSNTSSDTSSNTSSKDFLTTNLTSIMSTELNSLSTTGSSQRGTRVGPASGARGSPQTLSSLKCVGVMRVYVWICAHNAWEGVWGVFTGFGESQNFRFLQPRHPSPILPRRDLRSDICWVYIQVRIKLSSMTYVQIWKRFENKIF